jgi:uncharacterized protein
MSRVSDVLDLDRLGLRSGEGRRLDLEVRLEDFAFGGERYAVDPRPVPVTLDISRTTSSGWALRLRFLARLAGPCMRCLGEATPELAVDAREVQQPGGGEELMSPYVVDGDLDLHAWARDALLLSLPGQITCTPECRGLCAQCGADLNADPGHAHERPPDPRWAKLSEIELE